MDDIPNNFFNKWAPKYDVQNHHCVHCVKTYKVFSWLMVLVIHANTHNLFRQFLNVTFNEIFCKLALFLFNGTPANITSGYSWWLLWPKCQLEPEFDCRFRRKFSQQNQLNQTNCETAVSCVLVLHSHQSSHHFYEKLLRSMRAHNWGAYVVASHSLWFPEEQQAEKQNIYQKQEVVLSRLGKITQILHDVWLEMPHHISKFFTSSFIKSSRHVAYPI